MKAAFFDVDGTLTKSRVWHGLMDYFKIHKQNRIVHYSFNVYHHFLYLLNLIKLVPQVRFREIWAKNLAWYLGGLSVEAAEEVWDWVVKERINQMWRMDIVARLDEHNMNGYITFLVSGGPEGLLTRLSKELGVDHVVGTRHIIRNDIYTGKAPEEACLGSKKSILVNRYISECGLEVDLKSSYAYADSLGDLSLLEMVGNPVAVYPDEQLKSYAENRDWEIIEA